MRPRMMRLAGILLLLLAPAAAAQSQPATQALADGPLEAIITAFEGKFVSVRSAPDQAWVTPTVGMHLPEGAELRTGPKSLVQFKITDDQVITIDRLSTVQLIRANFASGKVMTDLGMKYGRTQYNIETAGRERRFSSADGRQRLVIAIDPPMTDEAFDAFRVLRRANLRLVERASPEDLRRVGVHAERGDESLEHMIRLYAGHDILHLRQIERILEAV